MSDSENADLNASDVPGPENRANLRRGWTTGTCAAAATKAAFEALVTGTCREVVEVELPGGGRPTFAVAICEVCGDGEKAVARAGVVKDAGDDPDVTHGALVVSTVRRGAAGAGIVFVAGEGVGTFTKPGLPLPPGEPAVNPVPRKMISSGVSEVSASVGVAGDVIVELSIPGGAALAEKTLNPRLGIKGGLSILGTTGIVIPYSCSAWIHSIHRGIDVARAIGLTHIAGATGSTSENAVRDHHNLPPEALIDMGDFVGGMLKYVRAHRVSRVTIAGGFAKMSKLGQGRLDLHSKRGSVDFDWLASLLANMGAPVGLVDETRSANTAQLALQRAGEQEIALGDAVAERAWVTAAKALAGSKPGQTDIVLDILVFDREGLLVGRTDAQSVQAGLPR